MSQGMNGEAIYRQEEYERETNVCEEILTLILNTLHPSRKSEETVGPASLTFRTYKCMD